MGQQYSLEEKKRAIQLFQILGHYTWVIAELGYPSRTMLHYWIKEYRRTGKIEVTNKTRRKYTVEQRKHAVEYYLSHVQIPLHLSRLHGENEPPMPLKLSQRKRTSEPLPNNAR